MITVYGVFCTGLADGFKSLVSVHTSESSAYDYKSKLHTKYLGYYSVEKLKATGQEELQIGKPIHVGFQVFNPCALFPRFDIKVLSQNKAFFSEQFKTLKEHYQCLIATQYKDSVPLELAKAVVRGTLTLKA